MTECKTCTERDKHVSILSNTIELNRDIVCKECRCIVASSKLPPVYTPPEIDHKDSIIATALDKAMKESMGK